MTNDIGAITTGMSGTAAPMTYKEVENNPAHTQITNNQLYMAYGNNASVVGLESHNFTDSDILTDGGLRIEMEIENLGNFASANHFCGFGVGISSNEMAILSLDYNNSNGPRGNTGSGSPGVADFYVDFSPNNGGIVQIFTQSAGEVIGSYPVSVGDLIGSSATLRADFYPDGFGASDNVDVYVYMAGDLVVKTNFTWTAANENYVAVSARQGNGFIGDNLLIESIVPVPVIASFAADPMIVDSGSSGNTVTLSWEGDFMDGGATYTISADTAVTYPGGDTGSAIDGLNQVDATVDGTLGDVEFMVVVDSGGTLLTNTTTVLAKPFAQALTTVLFTDSFDRVTGDITNDWNVSASKTGVGGTIAASLPATNFWLETHQDDNISSTNWNDSCTIITTNGTEQICRMSTGLASSMGLAHNFIDASILTDGGFSVAMDVSNFDNATGRDYYCGFGVGLSLAEVMALTDDGQMEGTGARGSVARNPGAMGASDLWAGITHQNANSVFQVLSKGVLIDEVPVGADAGNVRIDFGFDDFNAGSFVAYKLFFDEIQVGQGFFRWSGDDENYVVVSSRINNGVDVDNVTIGTINVPFTAPSGGLSAVPTIDLSGGYSNIVVTADAVSNVVSRVDIVQGSLIYNADEWQPLLVDPAPNGETAFDFDVNTNITLNIDATAYGWTNDPPQGYIRIKPVGWKIPVN